MLDDRAQKFGLPESLLIPIAARSVEEIELYVGNIDRKIVGRSGRVNAMAVVPHHWPPLKEASTPLWSYEKSEEYERRLHPRQQIWVHIDYTNYRKAYVRLNMQAIPKGYFLDHIQNREAIRLREYSHPYLRLCPVSRQVNTSGGTIKGGEGMEKDFLRSLKGQSDSVQEAFREKLNYGIVYADPMDLTKMLDITPGTQVLAGVGAMLKMFYAE